MIRKAEFEDIPVIRSLFKDYEDFLGLDLCFQGFQKELDTLPGIYQEPYGCILVFQEAQEIAGVVALKPLEEGVCEMKRLYVKPEFRSKKVGLKLAEAALKEATVKGYKIMKLDTLQRLEKAVNLYHHLGFQTTKAYNYNPDETVMYFEKNLQYK